MGRKFGYLRVMAGLALLGVGIGGCQKANEFQPPPPPKVTVAQPVTQQVVTYGEYSGRSKATVEVEIRARVRGFLRSVDFDEGATVEAGDLLYTIEPELYEAEVKSAEALLNNTKATLQRAEFEFTRIERLKSKAAAAEVEVIDADTGLQRAQAEVLSAEAALATAQLDLTYTKVTAPIAGRINRTEVNVGGLVGQGEQTLLTTIVPWNPMHVYVNIGERAMLDFQRRTAAGTTRDSVPVYVRFADGTNYPLAGKTDYFDNKIDATTGTMQVRAVFDNPDNLLVPGVFVRVRVPREPTESILVPESALQRDLVGYFVFVIDAQAEVKRVDVQVGSQIESYRTITAGLEGNEQVIVKGLQRVRPGVKVNAETIDLPPVEQPGTASVSTTATESANSAS